MREYIAILDTKFIGRHKVEITARNDDEALKKARKLENKYNELKALYKKGE